MAQTPERFNAHFQTTIITQHKFAFSPKYTNVGYRSLQPQAETETSLTATLFLGLRLWKGGELYLNPEVAGGAGVSRASGAAGFLNGETFRVGDPKPIPYFARYFFRQTIDLSENKNDENSTAVENTANQLSGKQPNHALVITAGKICLADIFDGNTASHDARSRFLNWGLMSCGSWDYPADVRGYTLAAAVEYRKNDLHIRFVNALVPDEANGATLDYRWTKANGSALEVEKGYKIGKQKGIVRALAYYNVAQMGKYSEALADPIPDITETRQDGRTKYGAHINAEHHFNDREIAFARLGWSDGNNETWAFTEIDNTLIAGYLRSFGKDNRFSWGAAVVSNGLLEPHRNYLARGGVGFIIGDGALNYGRENIFETFLMYHFQENYWLTLDYQHVVNAAYNQDRSGANALALRVHLEL